MRGKTENQMLLVMTNNKVEEDVPDCCRASRWRDKDAAVERSLKLTGNQRGH